MRVKRYAITMYKYLEASELQALLKILPSLPTRDRILFETLIHTGARASEILNLRFRDLNQSRQSVHITGLKGSSDREIPLPAALFRSLVELVSANAPCLPQGKHDPRLFNISYSRLQQLWTKYKPCGKPLHSLRHTFAVGLFKRTKSPRIVQVALGHVSLTNTMVYAAYAVDFEEMTSGLLNSDGTSQIA